MIKKIIKSDFYLLLSNTLILIFNLYKELLLIT